MKPLDQFTIEASPLWESYLGNFPGQLMTLSQQLQNEVQYALKADHGHAGLKTSYEPFMSLIAKQGLRLTVIADHLGMSKQACIQIADEIEAAGYIERMPDPCDGRAKIIKLTRRGRKLSADVNSTFEVLLTSYETILGKRNTKSFGVLLKALCRDLELPAGKRFQQQPLELLTIADSLPALSEYISRRLLELTKTKGHPQLRMSFGQLLPLIGVNGARIPIIAKALGISRQAVTAIANDMEDHGYLKRVETFNNRRQQVLMLTERGEALVVDSIAATLMLEAELEELISAAEVDKLRNMIRKLFEQLQLEVKRSSPPTYLATLAEQLIQELGEHNAIQLARLLEPN